MVYKLPQLNREEIQKMLGYKDIELKQTRFYQDVFAEGVVKIILLQLKHKLGLLSAETINRIQQLDSKQLESLCDNLLDFTAMNDLNTWLEKTHIQNHNSAIKASYDEHLI